MNGRRERRGNFAALGVSIAFLVCAYLAAHSVALAGSPPDPSLALPLPLLSQRQSVNVGQAHTEKNRPSGSYLSFPIEKPKGRIRVGVFGDSFVFGAGAPAGEDFPSLMSAEFAARGKNNVDVINFGVRGYGFHQSYLLWEYLGRRYDLDYVVLMPLPFHLWRDETFVFQNAVVHARFIVENGEAKLIEPDGTDRADAYRKYYSAIPAGKYLRYDKHWPSFFTLFFGRQIPNPLYFGRKVHFETRESYKSLFRKFGEEAPRVVLVCDDPDMAELGEASGAAAYVFRSRLTAHARAFPYLSNSRHPTALFNRLRAAELTSLLLGERHLAAPLLSLRETSFDGHPVAIASPLYEYTAVSVVDSRGRKAAVFTEYDKRGAAHDFVRRKTAAVLLFPFEKNAAFAALGSLLKPEEPVVLRFRCGTRRKEVPIGSVKTSTGNVGRIDVRLTDSKGAVGDGWRIEIESGDRLRLRLTGKLLIGRVRLFAGSQAVAEGSAGPDGNVRWKPLRGSWLCLRTPDDVSFDAESPVEGDFRVACYRGERLVSESPLFLSYSIRSRPVETIRRAYGHPIP